MRLRERSDEASSARCETGGERCGVAVVPVRPVSSGPCVGPGYQTWLADFAVPTVDLRGRTGTAATPYLSLSSRLVHMRSMMRLPKIPYGRIINARIIRTYGAK